MDLDYTKIIHFNILECSIIHSWNGTHPSNAVHVIEYRSNDDMYATIVHNKEDFYKKCLW